MARTMTIPDLSKAKDYAIQFRKDGMQCNCDLDNWEPEALTGHSWVCRIHKAAIKKCQNPS